MKSLASRFDETLRRESRFLERPSFTAEAELQRRLPYIGRDSHLETQRQRLSAKPRTFPYRLATITYSGTFFGLRQSIELDSLRFAIDHAARDRTITASERDWLVIAMCQVMSRINNSTGQFAQYLKPTRDNLWRIVQKRRRVVWDEFLRTVPSLAPLGDWEWRQSNRTFHCEGIGLLKRLGHQPSRPAVVYADPPYSKAQYSRYYHVLDVMAEYAYPKVAGVGRYAAGRFQTPFALARHVVKSMQDLVEAAAAAGSILLLSYPTNGLLYAQGATPMALLREHYRQVSIVHSSRRKHSSFGARLVAARVPATEHVYLAQGNRC